MSDNLPIPNPEHVRKIIEKVETAPYPSHMAMRLVELDFDRALVEIQLSNVHLQPYGIVHGGVIATIIDTATFWSAYLRIPEADGLVNVDLKLNYLESVTDGKLVAEATCIRPGKSVSYTEACVYDSQGRLIARGSSSIMVMPGRGLNISERKFLTEGNKRH